MKMIDKFTMFIENIVDIELDKLQKLQNNLR